MENANSHDYLHKIKSTVIENIRRTGKPSVEAFTNIPDNELLRADSDAEDEDDDLDADENPDKRVTQRQRDQQITHDNEFDDPSDDEEYRGSLGVRQQPGQKRRRGIMDFQNPEAVDDIDGDGTRGLNGESARSNRQPSAAPRKSVSRASSALPAANGTASARTRTPAVAADEDGDIEMGNASAGEGSSSTQPAPVPATAGPSDSPNTAPAATSQSASPPGVVTPPESPAAAQAADTTQDVDMADDAEQAEQAQKEKDEGLKERVVEEERGEAEAEAKTDK